MRRPVLGLVVATALAVAGLATSTARADASAPMQPKCVAVAVSPGTYRVFVDPGTVVAGDVQSVRAQQTGRDTQLTERRDGTWVGTVSSADRDMHFTIKSDARLFSERRFSSWLTCGTVKVRPSEKEK